MIELVLFIILLGFLLYGIGYPRIFGAEVWSQVHWIDLLLVSLMIVLVLGFLWHPMAF